MEKWTKSLHQQGQYYEGWVTDAESVLTLHSRATVSVMTLLDHPGQLVPLQLQKIRGNTSPGGNKVGRSSQAQNTTVHELVMHLLAIG